MNKKFTASVTQAPVLPMWWMGPKDGSVAGALFILAEKAWPKIKATTENARVALGYQTVDQDVKDLAKKIKDLLNEFEDVYIQAVEDMKRGRHIGKYEAELVRVVTPALLAVAKKGEGINEVWATLKVGSACLAKNPPVLYAVELLPGFLNALQHTAMVEVAK